MNKKVILNFIIKKFQLKKDDIIDENIKIFSILDILRIAKDTNFIRKSICHLPKSKKQMLIDLSFLNKIERFVYSSYYNFYMKKDYEIESGNEFNKKLTASIIKNHIKTYYKNYRFTKNTNKMIDKMRHKAYYDVFFKRR